MLGLITLGLNGNSTKAIIRTIGKLFVDMMRIVNSRSQTILTLRLINEIKNGGDLDHRPFLCG